MRKLFSIFISCMLIISMSAVVCAESYAGKDLDNDHLDVKNGILLHDTAAVKQSDRDDDFQHYADNKSTVVLNDGGQVNVVGIVRDYKDFSLISNAQIYMDDMLIVKSGPDGRFQIKNAPSGNHVWRIIADGYYASTYLNYELDDFGGANIFTFELCTDFPVEKDSTVIRGMNENCHGLFHENTNITTSMSAVPNVKSTIDVYYNGSVLNVDREEYIYTVTEFFSVLHCSAL